MRRIDRYVMSTVSRSIIMVTALVLSLDLLFAFIDELEDLTDNYTLGHAAQYMAMTIPRRLYDYLPLGAFMGCLIGLGVLAANSELVVLRAAGVSLWRIVLSAMKPGLVLVLIGMILGEYVAPETEKIAQSRKAVVRDGGAVTLVRGGLWHREGDEYIHVNAVEPNGRLHGISLKAYDANNELESIRFARRAIYHQGEWTLEDVKTTVFLGDQIVSRQTDYALWKTELTPSLLSVLVVKPEHLSIAGLHQYAEYLEDQNLSPAQYLLAFWKKALQPVSTLVLVFVAISFVFGPLRSVTMGFRVFSGLIVGLTFKYVQDLLGPSSLVFGFDPIFATLVPIFVCLLIGSVLLSRAG